VRLLANPLFLRAAIVLFLASFGFLLGLYLFRKLRNRITEEGDLSTQANGSLDTLQMHVYNTVIQQLKQQKHDLQVQSQAEQQRAKSTENFSQTVLSSLSCGLLVFGTNGLVKTSNPAAKSILGFASTAGMSAEDIFRGATAHGPTPVGVPGLPDETGDRRVRVKDEIHSVLRKGGKRQIETNYRTPAGDKRYLALTVSPVPFADGGQSGVTCVINDLSELESMRRQQQVQGEISAEMALRLRTSLTTIAGLAEQLASNRDPKLGKELATDIAHEAAQLDRSIGGFLTTAPTVMAVGSTSN
jgi:nitrogen fixation/metabolism regulation signal transduction histidine kinase